MKSKIKRNQNILMKGIAIIILMVMTISCLSLTTVNYAEEQDEPDNDLEETIEANESVDADDKIDDIEENIEEINASIDDINKKLETILNADVYKAQEFIKTIQSSTEISVTEEFELRALSLYVAQGNNCNGKVFNITKNINLKSGGEWDPIGSSSAPFSGTLNGYGHTISGMILTTKRSNVGLVGYLKKGKITNIKISDSTIAMNVDLSKDGINDLSSDVSSKYQNVGAIVGYAEDSKIIGCINNVNITGGSTIGGIVGYLYGTSYIQDCINNGDIIAYSRSGGIVGKANGSSTSCPNINRCINNGDVYAYYIDAGGIVATLHGTVSNCQNSGNVSISLAEITVRIMAESKKLKPENVGGIVGSVGGEGLKNIIENSITTENAKIFGYKDVGGIVGQLGNSAKGYSIARECISYSKYISSEYKYSDNKYSMGAIAGQVGSSKEVQTGRVYNCYYFVIEKSTKSGTETLMDISAYNKKINYGEDLYHTTELIDNAITIFAYGSYVLPDKNVATNRPWKMFYSNDKPSYENESGTNLYVEGLIYDKEGKAVIAQNEEGKNTSRAKRVLYNLVLYNNKIQWNRPNPKAGETDSYYPKYSTITATSTIGESYQPFLERAAKAFGGNDDKAGYSSSKDKLYIDLKAPAIESVSIKDVNNKNATIFANGDTLQIKVNFNENLISSRIYPTLELKINNKFIKATFTGIQEKQLIYEYTINENTYRGSSENNFAISGIKVTNASTDVFENKPSSELEFNKNINQYIILNTKGTKSIIYKNNPEAEKPTFTYQLFDKDPTQEGKYRDGADIAYDETTGYIKKGFSIKITSTENISSTSLKDPELKVHVVLNNNKELIIPYEANKDYIVVNEKSVVFNDIVAERVSNPENFVNSKVIGVYLTSETEMTGMGGKYSRENTYASISNKKTGNIYLDVDKPTVKLTGTNKTNYSKGEKLSIGMTISDNYILGGFVNGNTVDSISDDTIAKLKLIIKFGENGNNIELTPKKVSQSKTKLELTYDYAIDFNDEGKLSIVGISYNNNNQNAILTDLVGNKLELKLNNITTGNELTNKFADTTAPTVKITTDESNPTNKDNITYTFTWSEAVTGFTKDDITVIGGKIIGDMSKATDENKYTVNVQPDVSSGNEGELQVIVEKDVCKDIVGYGNIRAESIIKIDKKAPRLLSYTVQKDDNNKLEIQAKFDEAISKAEVIKIKFGDQELELTGDGNINENDKSIVTYSYNIPGVYENTPEIIIESGKVKDIAGNVNTETYSLANNTIFIKHTIKSGDIEYSISKNNELITDFSKNTYFKANDIISITTNENKTYRWTISGNYENKQMKFVNLKESEMSCEFVDTKGEGSLDISNANIYFDTKAPVVTIKAGVDAPNKDKVYTEGAIIKITAEANEKIAEPETTIPQIKVSFSESGIGKYNYQNDEKIGNAKYIGITEQDNKTIWNYTYEVQKGDEGKISLDYANSDIIVSDMAGNKTPLISYPNEITQGDLKLEGVNFGINTIVGYRIQKNGKELTADDFKNATYFKDGDKITVIATFNNTLYSTWGSTNTYISVSTAPKLNLTTSNNTTIGINAKSLSLSENKITYEYEVANQENSKLKTISLKVENTIYGKKADGSFETISNGKKAETNIDNCNLFIYNSNTEVDVGDIKADTLAPTVTIVAKKIDADNNETDIENNLTNASKIKYSFKWSEEVSDFDINDLTIINGNIEGELTQDKNDNRLYTLVVNNNIEEGNTGTIKVIVNRDAVKDVVGHANERAESEIRVDKQAPILIGLEAYVSKSEFTLNNEINPVKEYYKKGDIVEIIATFNENINVEESIPNLLLQFSESNNAKGKVEGKLNGNKIIYTYTITEGDEGTLSVKGFSGKVKDAAGNITTVTKRALNGDTIIADTVAPKLEELNIISPKTGTYKAGTKLTIEARYTEEVYALENNEIKKITKNNVPTLSLRVGNGNEVTAVFEGYGTTDGKVDESKLIYTYTIKDGDNGIVKITKYENKENVEICDLAGNKITLKVNQTGNEITADTIRPNVTNITAVVENPNVQNTSPYYKAGNDIRITLTFSENVSSAKIFPQILVGFSESDTEESQSYKSINTELSIIGNIVKYEYTIKDGDNGYLWVKVPENQYADIAGNGNTASKSFKLSNVFADTTNPTITLLRDTELNQANQTITVKATFNEDVYDLNNNSRVSLSTENAPKLVYSFGDGINKEVSASEISGPTITYVIKKDPVNDNGTLHYELAKGNLCDRAGNEYYQETTDTTAPELEEVYITTDSMHGRYCKKGVNIKVTAVFNEDIAKQNMKIKIKIGEGQEQEITGTINNDNKKEVIFNYTVKDGDNGNFKILDVQGNTLNDEKLTDRTYGYVQDKYGNQKNIFNFNGIQIRGEAIADTIAPTVTITSDVERTNKDTVTYTFTWSETVTGFSLDGIELANGLKGDFEAVPNTNGKVYTLKVDKVAEGIQVVRVLPGACIDLAGNYNEKATYNKVFIDYTKPIIRAKINGGNYVIDTENNKSILVEKIVANEELSKFEYVWSTSETIPETGWKEADVSGLIVNSDMTIKTEVSEENTYYLYLRVTDLAGNASEAKTNGFKVTKEEIILAANTTELTNQDITVSVTYGTSLTENRKAGVSGKTSSADATKVIVSENGIVYAEATDKAGNKVYKTLGITNIDKVVPEATIDYTTNDDGSVTAEISFNKENVIITNNSGNNTYKFTENGEFTFEFKDKAGNTGKATASVTNIEERDTIAPKIIFEYTLTTVNTEEPIGATILTDKNARIEYKWDNEEWTSTEDYVRSLNVSKEKTSIGKHILYAKATDESGNVSSTQTLEFNVVKKTVNPEIIFEGLTTLQVNNVKYVKISDKMSIEEVNDKMDIEALGDATPEYDKLTEDGKLKTGSEIKLDGETHYIVIVNGDVNCDGKVSPIDVTMANSARLGKAKMTTAQMLAADFDSSNSINPIDITMINSYRLGKVL